MKTAAIPCFLSLALTSLLPAWRASAAPGNLDLSFGTGGKVMGDFTAIALQNDGRIVAVAGGRVHRFLPSGAPDLTFGGIGSVASPLYLSNAGRAVAVQADGKVVGVGTVSSNLGDLAVIRFNADGSVDSSFGGLGTGIVSQNITTGIYRVGTEYYYEPSQDTGVAVAVLNSGLIVAVGKAFYKNSNNRPVGMGTISFTADGSAGGSSFKGLGSGDYLAGAYVNYGFQNGGGVTSVVAGPDGGFATSAWSIHTGSVVEVFGQGSSSTLGGNLRMTRPELPFHDECHAVGYTPGGGVVHTGSAQLVDYSNYPLLTGSYIFYLNNSTPAGTGLGTGRSLAVQPDDRIIVGAGSLIQRFTDSITLDSSFQMPAGISANFQTLLMQPDGKLLAAGGGIWRFETGVTYPEIAVEQPAGTELTDGAAGVALGTVPVARPPAGPSR